MGLGEEQQTVNSDSAWYQQGERQGGSSWMISESSRSPTREVLTQEVDTWSRWISNASISSA